MEEDDALMVAGITPGMALRDVVFSAGLGMLLCAGYCLFGFLLGWRRPVRFAADLLVLMLGAFFLRSAASMRFYSGFVRWYDAAACVGAFLMCHALLEPVARRWRRLLLRPVRKGARKAWMPVHGAILQKKESLKEKHRKYREKKQKSRLQNTAKVLYNSYHGDIEASS